MNLPEGIKSRDLKKYLDTNVPSDMSHISRTVGTTQLSTDGWMDTHVCPSTCGASCSHENQWSSATYLSVDGPWSRCSVRHQTPKATWCVTPFLWIVHNRLGSWVLGAGQRLGGLSWGRGSLRDDGNVLKLMWWWLHTSVTLLNKTELCALNGALYSMWIPSEKSC